MSRSFKPSVSPEIFDLRPDYRALSIVAEGVVNAARHPESDKLVEDCRAGRQPPSWGDAHLEAWRVAYRAFGAKPQRTPSSAEALSRRLQVDGRLPAINAVVDLYNAVSIRFAIPIGGENVSAYSGSPLLKRAAGGEAFDTMKEGSPILETVPTGEVIWADERGATCRRWNWRQGVRTRIDLATTRMWFVIERLEPMPTTALHEVGNVLMDALRSLSPGAIITSAMIDAPDAASLNCENADERSATHTEDR
mgnify:CR=1 FL=1